MRLAMGSRIDRSRRSVGARLLAVWLPARVPAVGDAAGSDKCTHEGHVVFTYAYAFRCRVLSPAANISSVNINIVVDEAEADGSTRRRLAGILPPYRRRGAIGSDRPSNCAVRCHGAAIRPRARGQWQPPPRVAAASPLRAHSAWPI
ncbi:hypothetical protein ACJJTC_018436 [Scirpophaga incertulas]